ncbi:MAG: tyrosine-type recombinase/integrase [Alphaproteobacteria bacterium]|nr:tyrosine-type recombinase/integrase [Alphaproteobacteria bacterium]
MRNFTTTWLENVRIPKADKTDYYDTAKGSPSGFGVRVSHTGRKTFFVKYLLHGKQKRTSIPTRDGGTATFPAIKLSNAREMARKLVSDVKREGKAPASIADQSFAGVARSFVDEYSKGKKRSWRTDQRILIDHTYFSPFHERKADEITRGEIVDQLQKIKRDNGPVMANRCLAAIRKMYNWAIRNGKLHLDFNPAMGIDRPGGEIERDRVYTDDEIAALWKTFDQMGISGQVLKLALVTGQRLNECAAMEKSEISGNAWNIPAARSKNKRPHVVPLSDLALEIISDAPSLSETYVFPSPSGMTGDVPIKDFSNARRKVRELSGVSDFQPHDLRRSCATNITKLGFGRFVADCVLNHAQQGVGRVYDRYEYLKEKTEALDAWATHLQAILSDNVVSLEDRRA